MPTEAPFYSTTLSAAIGEAVFASLSAKEEFIRGLKSNVYCLPEPEFYAFANKVLEVKPLCHITGFTLDNGINGILINRDFYKYTLGEDFSDCIPYEILFTSLTMWNCEQNNKYKQRRLDLVRETVDSIRKDGKFGRFLGFKERQLFYYYKQGDADCLDQMDQWYKEYSLYLNIGNTRSF